MSKTKSKSKTKCNTKTKCNAERIECELGRAAEFLTKCNICFRSGFKLGISLAAEMMMMIGKFVFQVTAGADADVDADADAEQMRR